MAFIKKMWNNNFNIILSILIIIIIRVKYFYNQLLF